MASKKRAAKPSTTTNAAEPAAQPSVEGTIDLARGRRGVVAVTGAFGFLGRRLLRRLEEDASVERIVCVDVKSPLGADDERDPAAWLNQHAKLSAHRVDLTEAGADRELATIFQREGVGSIVHLAFLSNPTHHAEMAHELETIGTLYVLHAADAARVGQVVSLSSTMCYGARTDNPAWITEEQPLRPPQSRSLRDKAEADEAVRRFGETHPDVDVAVARVGAILPGGADHLWTRIFSRPVVPTLLGYDPLLQLLHPDDAAAGLYALWRSRARGAFNVVGRGVLPLSRVVRRIGRVGLPLPARLGGAVMEGLWSAQLVEMPPRFLEFLRWPWVCDGGRLKAATGFVPAHDIDDVLRRFTDAGAVEDAPPMTASQAAAVGAAAGADDDAAVEDRL